MKRKIVLFTTEGYSREDGNIYYSYSVLVETNNDKLDFTESIFEQFNGDRVEATQAIIDLGYTVHDLDNLIVEVSSIY